MRILCVASPLSAPSGVWTFVKDFAAWAEAAGIEIRVVVSVRFDPSDEVIPPAFELVPDHDRPIVHQRALRARLTTLVDAWQPDVVVSMIAQSDIAVRAVCATTQTPWLPMIHGSPVPRPGEAGRLKRAVWTRALKEAYSRGPSPVVVSSGLAAELEAAGLARAPNIVQNGISVLDQPVTRDAETPTWGFVGRLSIEKGIRNYVELIEASPEARAIVVGAGPFEPLVAGAVERTGRIDARGWVPREAAFDDIDVLLSPSAREGLPLTLLEAGARGIPVLASDVGGVRDVLGLDPVLEQRCLMPASFDVDEWRAAMKTMLPLDDRRELGLRLRQVVQEHFAADRQFRRLLDATAAAAVPRSGGALSRALR